MQRVNKIVGSGSLKGKRRWGKLRILATVLIQSAIDISARIEPKDELLYRVG